MALVALRGMATGVGVTYTHPSSQSGCVASGSNPTFSSQDFRSLDYIFHFRPQTKRLSTYFVLVLCRPNRIIQSSLMHRTDHARIKTANDMMNRGRQRLGGAGRQVCQRLLQSTGLAQ